MDGKRQKERHGLSGQDGVSWLWIEKPRKKEQVLLGLEGRGQRSMPFAGSEGQVIGRQCGEAPLAPAASYIPQEQATRRGMRGATRAQNVAEAPQPEAGLRE